MGQALEEGSRTHINFLKEKSGKGIQSLRRLQNGIFMTIRGFMKAKILYTYVGERSSQDMTALVCYYVTHLDWWHSWWPNVPSVCNYHAESMFRLDISPYFTTIYVTYVFINGNNILKCFTTCHSNTNNTIM